MSNLIPTEKTKSELLVIDEITKFIFDTYDLDWNIDDLFWYEYHGFGRLIHLESTRKEGEPLSKSNIYITFDWYEERLKREREGWTSTPNKQLLSDVMYGTRPQKIVAQSQEEFSQDLELLINGKISMQELVEAKYPTESTSQETGLMIMNKDILIQKKKELVERQEYAMSRAAAARVLLEKRKDELRAFAGQMSKFIQKLNRLIWSIELYLGINEELQQFGFGKPAPADAPISLRQRKLFMDEEVGEPMDDMKGLDFQSIEVFDKWLMDTSPYYRVKNYELMAPEQKCVVIFQVRRNDKEYTSNPFINSLMNVENRKTYILIRNGENIFRIYADITIGDKLFPDQQELTELVEKMEGSYKSKPGEWRSTNDPERAEETIERYKLNVILLQGIIERTPCFPDNSATTSIFDPNGYEGKINFVYDATASQLLPSHIPTFNEWKNTLNESIDEGNRIFLIRGMYSRHWGRGNDKSRFFKVYYSDHSVPSPPATGVYQLYADHKYEGRKKIEGKPLLYIKYNPKDEVAWSWSRSYQDRDDYTRKNRLSWAVYRSDSFFINWDAIDRDQLETLEFYLYTRIGRTEYLSYIPMLYELFKEKKKEIAEEDNFLRLCLNQAGLDEDNYFGLAIRAMEWWKLKNKWKRALNTDDTKALRMIVKRLQS
jgi:hypothetical protein